MSRKNRISKTLNRKLSDLDDHLYFLKESLAKLSSGDSAYLKTLAVELRVLVCKASGTEGLLWRVMDEVKAHDAVYVHLPGNLDRDHPLAKGLQFMFVPIFRAGQGDPRLKPEHYSLMGIIKKCEAIVVSGNGYTHENLIRAIAEQMGSAHEDEGVEKHLIELSGTVISNQAALNAVFITEADLVIEVGERVLNEAVNNMGFNRVARTAISLPSNPVKSYQDALSADFEVVENAIPDEGTAMFLANHPHSDWRTNTNRYNFGVTKQGGLTIRTMKHPDQTMEVQVQGLSDDVIETRKPIPNSDTPGVMVGFTWTHDEIKFYLNGMPVDTLKYNKRANKPLLT